MHGSSQKKSVRYVTVYVTEGLLLVHNQRLSLIRDVVVEFVEVEDQTKYNLLYPVLD